MNISIIIPVFHEEKNITKVLQRIKSVVHTQHEIIIVYDSDDDPTIPVAKQFLHTKNSTRIILIKNRIDTQKGVMNAIKTGFAHAKGEAIVVVMADLADDISQIDTMYELIKKGNDIVCASRFMKGGEKIGGPVIKTLLSRIACFTLHTFFKIPTHDATNAFKMYRASIFKDIQIESTGGFEYSLEIILKAWKKGYAIAEIPTVWKDREEGKSNFKLLSWLPNYVMWYMTAVPKIFFNESISSFAACVFLSLVVLSLSLLQIAYVVKNRILLTSPLDFSWVSDAVERYLHGYIAGRDYIYTYGPAFQFLYAIPSLLFHIPSYIGILFAPMLVNIILIGITYVFARSLSRNTKELVYLFGLLLGIVGIINNNYANILLRSLIPLLFTVFCMNVFGKKRNILITIALALLPTLVGLYSYDLFLMCLFIEMLFFFYKISLSSFVILVLSSFSQVIGSFIISHNLAYTYYSLVTIFDYSAIMNTAWEYGKANYLFIFPVSLPFLLYALFRQKTIMKKQKKLLIALTVVSLLNLRIAFIRSDAGHIEMSTYPSIVTAFLLLYFLLRTGNSVFYIIGIIFFSLIPFHQNSYTYLSLENLKTLWNVIREKPDFFSLYKLPANYFLSQKDFQKLSVLIHENNENVLVYPYDSYILNIYGTTYNTFPLQFYGYSHSAVEQKAVELLDKNPPKYILLGIDGKGALQIDNMPNFTRNPLFAKWMLTHYQIIDRGKTYSILQYSQHIKRNPSCIGYNLHLHITRENFLDALVKPSLYYLNKTIKLPYRSKITEYFIPNSLDVLPNFQLYRQNPFTHKFALVLPNEYSASLSCY